MILYKRSTRAFIRVNLETALREAEGLISGPTGAASKLGIPRQTLESKIRKLGINRHRFKTSYLSP